MSLIFPWLFTAFEFYEGTLNNVPSLGLPKHIWFYADADFNDENSNRVLTVPAYGQTFNPRIITVYFRAFIADQDRHREGIAVPVPNVYLHRPDGIVPDPEVQSAGNRDRCHEIADQLK